MKRSLLLLLVILVCVSMVVTFSLAGCKKEEGVPTAEEVAEEAPAEEAAPAEEEEVKEEVTINELMFSGAAQEVLIDQADRYMEANPNVTINIVWTDYASLHEKMMTELVGGTGAFDVMAAITDFMPEFIRGGYLEPLDSYIENDPPEDWPDDIPEGLLKFQRDSEGNLYGLPWWDGPVMFYYRTDLFNDSDEKAAFRAEYGYDLSPPETWDEFLDISKFFTRDTDGDGKTDFYGTVLGAKQGGQNLVYDVLIMFYTNGIEVIDENYKPVFNTGEGAEALQFYADLINKYKVAPKASTTFDVPESGDFFLTGNCAIHWNWTHIAGFAEDPEKSKIVGNCGYGLMPKGPNGSHKSLSIYWTYAIPKASQNKEVAYDYIKFLISKDMDLLMADYYGQPVRLSTWNDPELVEKFPFFPWIAKTHEDVGTSPQVAEFTQINDLLQIAAAKVIAEQMSAKDALDEAAEDIENIMEEAGYYK